MASPKRPAKAKVALNELLIDDCDMFKPFNKTKKPIKRKVRKDDDSEKDITKLAGLYSSCSKINKVQQNSEESMESGQKLISTMEQQLTARQQRTNGLLSGMANIIDQFEADHEVLKNNEHKLQYLSEVYNKCMQQTTAAHKQKISALKEIHDNFKRQVEGLLTRGAMKPDDRPLWFDVYKAFPPIREPKYAQPKPETTIKPILYKEDILRAKFQSQGQGLSVNMLYPTGDTQIKKLVKQYEKLEAEGVPKTELIEKSIAAVGAERQLEAPSPPKIATPKNPETVTAQVLADADLKNIFKE